MSFEDVIADDTRNIVGGDFTTPVLMYPDEPDETEIVGIFDEVHLEVDLETNTEYLSTDPQLLIFEPELARSPVSGDRCRIKDQLYEIKHTEPDGQGCLILYLKTL